MNNFEKKKKNNKIVYSIKGMHCQSCEILIEKRVSTISGVLKVSAQTDKGAVTIEYDKNPPKLAQLNDLLRNDGYTFSSPNKEDISNIDPQKTQNNIFNKYINYLIFFVLFILIVYFFAKPDSFGLSSLINVNSKSSLIFFFLFGIIAGVSTCAALVGGIVLAMSRQWLDEFSSSDSMYEKAKPHILFNFGRLASYGFFGALLGLIGSKIEVSQTFSSILIFVVSALMLIIGFQLLGLKFARKFRLALPKIFTNEIANEKNFNGRFMPAILGALTFFLPCGFTITAQGIALLSGSALRGGLIMFLFALGTLPMLLLIGLSSVSLFSKKELARRFSLVAGVMVIFFAVLNINSQFNVLNLPSLNDIKLFKNNENYSSYKAPDTSNSDDDLVPIIDGKQVMKMSASSTGYSPSHFKVRAGVPVLWEINDTGTSGCTSAVIAKNLFDGQINLTPGTTSTKEFTPIAPGTYKFSCWMGMITGTIEVIGKK